MAVKSFPTSYILYVAGCTETVFGMIYMYSWEHRPSVVTILLYDSNETKTSLPPFALMSTPQRNDLLQGTKARNSQINGYYVRKKGRDVTADKCEV